MAYKVVIIDDETRTRSLIHKMLEKTNFELDIVGEANNVLSGSSIIRQQNPDIVLLDIQMPDGSGFDLLEGLRNRAFEVIFITAHEEFAIRAIKFSALDYILKPIEKEELESAMESAISTIREKRDSTLKYDTLLKNLKEDNKKIVLKTNTSMYVVDMKSIISCQSDRNYTNFLLEDGRKILTSRSLKEYENILPSSHFLRCHRSYIINVDFIDRYERRDGGSIIMKDESEIPLSRSSKENFLEVLDNL